MTKETKKLSDFIFDIQTYKNLGAKLQKECVIYLHSIIEKYKELSAIDCNDDLGIDRLSYNEETGAHLAFYYNPDIDEWVEREIWSLPINTLTELAFYIFHNYDTLNK